jgi:flagellar hook-associated protein 2
VSDLIPGVTFQLLSTSSTAVQVVIANYNSGVESSVSTLVSDYNALVSAMNTQEGNDSSGNAEPLYGSPTLTMLQQDILGGINTENPNGYLAQVNDSLDPTVSGSMNITTASGGTVKVVVGAAPSAGADANTIYTGSGVETLSGLAAAINSAVSDITLSSSVTAGADASGSTGATTSSATLTAVPGYSSALSGSFSVTVGGGTAENIVIGAEPSTGAEANTIYTGSGVNTLSGIASAINDASTKITASVTVGADASGSISAITSTATLTANAGAVLAGTVQVLVGSGTAENIVIGAEPSTGAADNTIYTGSGVNTLSGLADTINGDTSLGLTATVTTASDGSQTLELTSGTSGSAGTLTVTPTLTASLGFTASVTTSASDGSQTLNLTSGVSGSAGTLTVATGITGSDGSVTPTLIADGLGVTAAVVTKNGQSSLTLTSQTTGASGAVSVTSAISATSDTAVTASVMAGTDATMDASGNLISATTSTATLGTVEASDDALIGSVVIQVGDGAAQTITLDSQDNSLSGLATAINDAKIGVDATVTTASDGSQTLTMTSGTTGSAGTLSVTSSILDTTNTSTAALGYTSSSDIGSLSGLGVSVNEDGTLSLDASTLDAVLNTDYSSVAGFFQNVDSWGVTFANMLSNAGTSSSTGILKLAENANSSIESSLNKNITREETLISAQQASLTAELNSANEIMQMIPTQLQGINELYSAITGYGTSSSS